MEYLDGEAIAWFVLVGARSSSKFKRNPGNLVDQTFFGALVRAGRQALLPIFIFLRFRMWIDFFDLREAAIHRYPRSSPKVGRTDPNLSDHCRLTLIAASSGTLKKDLQFFFPTVRFTAEAGTGTPNFGQLSTHSSIRSRR